MKITDFIQTRSSPLIRGRRAGAFSPHVVGGGGEGKNSYLSPGGSPPPSARRPPSFSIWSISPDTREGCEGLLAGRPCRLDPPRQKQQVGGSGTGEGRPDPAPTRLRRKTRRLQRGLNCAQDRAPQLQPFHAQGLCFQGPLAHGGTCCRVNVIAWRPQSPGSLLRSKNRRGMRCVFFSRTLSAVERQESRTAGRRPRHFELYFAKRCIGLN